jgi:hypothetical protein
VSRPWRYRPPTAATRKRYGAWPDCESAALSDAATDALDSRFDNGWVFHAGLGTAPQLVPDDFCERGISPLTPPLRHPHGLLGQEPGLGLLGCVDSDVGTGRGGENLALAVPVRAVRYALVPPDVLAGALSFSP